jgi:hypothetical protein
LSPVKAQRGESIGQALARVRAQTERAKALKRFRPRKSERESFLLLDKAGRRLDEFGREKGYAVYVDRNGKLKPVDAPADGAAKYKRHRFSSFNATRKRGRKRATQKLYKDKLVVHSGGVYVRRRGAGYRHSYLEFDESGHTLDLLPDAGIQMDYLYVSRLIGARLTRVANGMRGRLRRQFSVWLSLTVKDTSGQQFLLSSVFPEFSLAHLQRATRDGATGFFMSKFVYGQLAEMLKHEHDGIFGGSYRRVRRVSMNRGSDPAEFRWGKVDEKGVTPKWRHALEFDADRLFEIVRVEYSIRRIT